MARQMVEHGYDRDFGELPPARRAEDVVPTHRPATGEPLREPAPVAVARAEDDGCTPIRLLDGVAFDVQISAARNRNADGESVGCVFSLVDISDRKRAEDAERELERRRVMLESLGAACHHLGQPATVLLANLGIIQKRWEIDDEVVMELVQGSITAAETLGDILHKLNTVNEYRTTAYLERPDGSDFPENRILCLQHSHYVAWRILHFFGERASGRAFSALITFLCMNLNIFFYAVCQ
jgi:hypothetical protein